MPNDNWKKIKEELAEVITENINPQFDALGERVDSLGERVGRLEEDVSGIKNQMVTKSYLDDKLADLSGEVIIKLRKEDAKVNWLIEMMGGKKILDQKEIKELEGMKIFPRPSVNE